MKRFGAFLRLILRPVSLISADVNLSKSKAGVDLLLGEREPRLYQVRLGRVRLRQSCVEQPILQSLHCVCMYKTIFNTFVLLYLNLNSTELPMIFKTSLQFWSHRLFSSVNRAQILARTKDLVQGCCSVRSAGKTGFRFFSVSLIFKPV